MTTRDSASLTRLPTELRLRIYELVLGGRLIHVRRRTDSPERLVYTVCEYGPQGEDDAYARSKDISAASENFAHITHWADERFCTPFVSSMSAYSHRHHRCFEVLKALEDGVYTDGLMLSLPREHLPVPQLPHPPDRRHRARLMERMRLQRALLISRYGHAARGGLDKLLPFSKFDVGLLRVCREMYRETRLLPYSNNVFAFGWDTSHNNSPLLHRLQPEQAKAIHHIHLSEHFWNFNMLQHMVQPFRGLCFLELCLIPEIDIGTSSLRDQWTRRLDLPTIPIVKVQVGFVKDDEATPRALRRRQAQLWEDLLTGSYCSSQRTFG